MLLPFELTLLILHHIPPEKYFTITFNLNLSDIDMEVGDSIYEKMWVFSVKKDFRMIRWLHENNIEGCRIKIMDIAAALGNLLVVEYLHSHRTEGCSFDALNDAAGNGHLDVVKFIVENINNNDHYNIRKAKERAAADGQQQVLEYLLSI